MTPNPLTEGRLRNRAATEIPVLSTYFAKAQVLVDETEVSCGVRILLLGADEAL